MAVSTKSTSACIRDRSGFADRRARYRARFAGFRARVVFGENPDLSNPKIANLAKDGVITSRDVVVIADSDIRVGREYLRALVPDFESQAVGAVAYFSTPGHPAG